MEIDEDYIKEIEAKIESKTIKKSEILDFVKNFKIFTDNFNKTLNNDE